MVWVPPVPVVVEYTVVQALALADSWTWNAVAQAASHCRTTWVIVGVAPRSTWIHCGSLKALDQRVPALPSTAAPAGKAAFSLDEAVAGRPCDSSEVAALAGSTTSAVQATSARLAAASRMGLRSLRARDGAG